MKAALGTAEHVITLWEMVKAVIGTAGTAIHVLLPLRAITIETAIHVLTLREAKTWKYCNEPEVKAVIGTAIHVLIRLGAATWKYCNVRGVKAAPGLVNISTRVETYVRICFRTIGVQGK